ncbi:MAG: MgtC/SapB family protein [Candidatus Pedobacter colombiensis]|uniref:MgtC/SapB family protein n=1 Tax=Candidatus Pedobacter colombiensis TaxID=3121371 RepID=A0AAJ6B8R9_9SPHI|nr:MgtC/SapB family protein [Pedobacter sp.]WEK19428.1 MAG: MgtC/SapB family protein [Pedobacter sp.]
MHQTILSAQLYHDEILKIFLSVVCGSILGFEREVRGKSAGFRTLALICFGSTIFTICSYLLGVEDNRDRIAANIITGIGFLGAGVIFRNNISVSGITTAASIWIAAAIGMLIGIGEYALAGISVVLALFILYAMDYIQFWIDDRFQHRDYRIVFKDKNDCAAVQEQLKVLNLRYNSLRLSRTSQHIIMEVRVSGKKDKLEGFNSWLLDQRKIDSFDW